MYPAGLISDPIYPHFRRIKSPQLLCECLGRERSLITDKQKDLGLYSMCHGDFAALGKPSPNINHTAKGRVCKES